jgi:hypothetical protein
MANIVKISFAQKYRKVCSFYDQKSWDGKKGKKLLWVFSILFRFYTFFFVDVSIIKQRGKHIIIFER